MLRPKYSIVNNARIPKKKRDVRAEKGNFSSLSITFIEFGSTFKT